VIFCFRDIISSRTLERKSLEVMMTYKEPLVHFTANVSLAEKQALETAAKSAGTSRASYVRQVLATHLESKANPQAAA